MSAFPFDAVVRSARDHDGAPPFSDGSLVEYAQGARRLVTIADAAAALVGGTGSVTEAEFVVAPHSRRQGLGTAMVARLQRDSAQHLLIWSHGDLPGARVLAQRHGFERMRELLRLRGAVAGAGNNGSTPGSDRISTFDPARDTDDLLALNAAAFAGHPEQGSLSKADLDTTMQEPWFSRENLLLLRDPTGHLVAFCWLKVDGSGGGGNDGDVNDGEFYVVGVAPDRQGEGLGRRAIDAGMARLRELGIRSTHLYVEGDNTAALRLYHSFGFREASIDVQYRWERSQAS